MSDINISGIPNMGFAGGGGGYLGGNAATGTPAMSSAQIMASLYGNYSPGAAQSTLNNIYGAGGFGAQPAYYAALGAAYGRQVAPSSPAAVAAANQGAPIYDPWTGALSGYGPAASDPGATANVPSSGSLGSMSPFGGYNPYGTTYQPPSRTPTYNAPMSYGWTHNEGAAAPAAPQTFQRGMFNPQTYGWDANEGASSQGTPQYDPWTGAFQGYSGGGGGGYDIGGQSRSVQSPLQGFDWAQSYMPNYSTGGAFQQALLRSQYQPFNTGGGYNPWASNNTSLPTYSNMFGSPGSGYLGSQGRLNQDPFGAYVNPRDLDAGGSFPGNYAPGYNAMPINQGFGVYMNDPFGGQTGAGG